MLKFFAEKKMWVAFVALWTTGPRYLEVFQEVPWTLWRRELTIHYLHFSYIDDLKNVDDPEIQLSREFIIEHLLMIASYMDTADQASR